MLAFGATVRGTLNTHACLYFLFQRQIHNLVSPRETVLDYGGLELSAVSSPSSSFLSSFSSSTRAITRERPISVSACCVKHIGFDNLILPLILGGAVVQVRARFPLWTPAPFWLGRCQYNVTGGDRSHGILALSRVWQNVNLPDVSLGTRPRYSLVADEDVKRPNKQSSR